MGKSFLFRAMQYDKPHLTYANQTRLLLERGMLDPTGELTSALQQTGYYRLSAYWHPYRVFNVTTGSRENSFLPHTTFKLIWDHYRFDRNLRLLFLDAIERIEVALRCRLAYLHTQSNNPFAYANASYFPKWKHYMSKLQIMKKPERKSSLDFVNHFFNKYGDEHKYLPLWMGMGIADFGFISFFYQHSQKEIRSQISREWGVKSNILRSWLIALNTLRNTCAHHSRVWNKVWGTQPLLPSFADQPLWYMTYLDQANKWARPPCLKLPSTYSINQHQNSTGALLYICKYLLSFIAPQSQWKERIEELFSEFTSLGINIEHMGLSKHWTQHPLWK